VSQVSKGVQGLLKGGRLAIHRERQRLEEPCEGGPSGSMAVDSKLPPWPHESRRLGFDPWSGHVKMFNGANATDLNRAIIILGSQLITIGIWARFGNNSLVDKSEQESLKYRTWALVRRAIN